MSGADRMAMDQHNYLGFSTPSNDSVGYQATKPCAYWAMNYNNSMTNFGLSFSGEWSLAVNDCGVYLNNVGNGARFDGTYIAPGSTTPTFTAVGDCTTWNDWPTWDDDRKAGLQQVAYAHMDATQNWFFWTWKIGTSIKTGFAPNPMWHMKRECNTTVLPPGSYLEQRY
jgi:glucan 1,3-beta-glucosidase